MQICEEPQTDRDRLHTTTGLETTDLLVILIVNRVETISIESLIEFYGYFSSPS